MKLPAKFYLLLIAAFFIFDTAAMAAGTHEGRLKPVSSQGNIIASIDTRPAPLSLGNNEIFLTLMDSNKKSIQNASVSVSVSMPGMVMKTDKDYVKLDSVSKMRYRGVVNITMGGTWHVIVHVDHGGAHEVIVFEEKVKWE